MKYRRDPKRSAALGACALLLAAPHAARALPTDSDLARQILAVHNKERAAVSVPPLSWSDSLAADAKPWAEHLAQLGRMQHEDQHREGENLAMGTAGAYTPTDMAQGWADEKAYFQPGIFPDGVSANVGGNWHMLGHYTQMIWRKTSEVGCAMATGHDLDVLVCRYAPPGNIVGHRPF